MRMPFAPLHLIIMGVLLVAVVIFVHVGILSIAFDKLGLSPTGAMLLILASLIGAGINIPLVTIQARPEKIETRPSRFSLLLPPQQPFRGKTVIAINVGGCIVPVLFSLYLLTQYPLPFLDIILGIAVVTVVSRLFSQPITGIGIGMPLFIAPITAALAALTLNADSSAPLAYISGTLGVLTGADLSRFGDIRRMGVPFASIGGAGTFDGIFLTGIVAVLLA